MQAIERYRAENEELQQQIQEMALDNTEIASLERELSTALARAEEYRSQIETARIGQADANRYARLKTPA